MRSPEVPREPGKRRLRLTIRRIPQRLEAQRLSARDNDIQGADLDVPSVTQLRGDGMERALGGRAPCAFVLRNQLH